MSERTGISLTTKRAQVTMLSSGTIRLRSRIRGGSHLQSNGLSQVISDAVSHPKQSLLGNAWSMGTPPIRMSTRSVMDPTHSLRVPRRTSIVRLLQQKHGKQGLRFPSIRI